MINCSHTRVTDLSPLAGMRLTHLYCDGTTAPDLAVLRGMPLAHLNCSGYDLTAEVNRETLRSLKKLEVINSAAAAEFWKEVGQEE
jgi:hypothetical protein